MHGVLTAMEDQDFQVTSEIGLSSRWYALLVGFGMERKVCIWLRRRQFSPYWPRYKGPVKLNRHRRQIRWRGVIPGYLFLPVPICDEINCPLLEKAPGSPKIMRAIDNHPREIKDYEVDRIKEIEVALNESVIAAAEGIPFRRGQQVRIPKLEMDAKIMEIDSARRIVLEAALFGRMIKFTVAASDIESI